MSEFRLLTLLKFAFVTLLSVLLISCNDGGHSTNSFQNSSDFSVSTNKYSNAASIHEFMTKICGGEEKGKLEITEANDAPVNKNFILGDDDRGLNAAVVCENGARVDVPFLANWSSSNKKIMTVTNTSEDKGYITTVAPGVATLTVSTIDPNYSSKIDINVSKEPVLLKGIQVSLGRSTENIIAKGEVIGVIVEGNYSDGSKKIIKDAVISTKNINVIQVDQNSNTIKGINQGDFTLMASFQGFTDSLDGKVLPAKIVGLRLNPDSVLNSSIAIPQTVALKGKLLLSDNSLIDIPDSKFEKPSITSCLLQKLPDDLSTPFYNNKGGCNITSTTESGVNQVTMRYDILDPNDSRTVLETFESKAILTNTDSNIKSIHIDELGSLPASLSIGEPYRFKVSARLLNNSTVDITNSVKLTAVMTSDGKDYSDKIIVANVGYIGVGDGVDDGKGAVIKVTKFLRPNNYFPVEASIYLRAVLGKFTTPNVGYIKTLLPEVISMEELSSYMASKMKSKILEQRNNIITFYGFDKNYNIESTDASAVLNRLNSANITLEKVTDESQAETIHFEKYDDKSPFEVSTDITVPRISFKEEVPEFSMVSVLCNYSKTNQTFSSQSKTEAVTNTTGISRGLSVGFELGQEITVGIAKTTFKVNGGYNQSWSFEDSHTLETQLPSQAVLLPPLAKALVIQKMYKSKMSYRGIFDIPLTADSCLPFMQSTAGLTKLQLYSLSCIPYAKVAGADPLLDLIFPSGINSMRFSATVTSEKFNLNATTDGNTVNIYVYEPNDQGYASLKCDDKSNSAGNFLSKDDGSVLVGGNKINLNSKNLKQVITYQ